MRCRARGQAIKRREVDEGKDLGRKLDLHRKTIQREREVDTVRRHSRRRRQHRQLLESKVELELKLKGESETLRHAMEGVKGRAKILRL